MQRRRSSNKFGAIKTVIDGIEFPSILQSKMYLDLKNQFRLGLISNLKIETSKKKIKIPIIVNNKKICEYWADATYIRDNKQVIVDAKGVRTSTFNLKWKLLKALYPNYVFELFTKQKITSSSRRR